VGNTRVGIVIELLVIGTALRSMLELGACDKSYPFDAVKTWRIELLLFADEDLSHMQFLVSTQVDSAPLEGADPVTDVVV
jgi:hypothetical protein